MKNKKTHKIKQRGGDAFDDIMNEIEGADLNKLQRLDKRLYELIDTIPGYSRLLSLHKRKQYLIREYRNLISERKKFLGDPDRRSVSSQSNAQSLIEDYRAVVAEIPQTEQEINLLRQTVLPMIDRVKSIHMAIKEKIRFITSQYDFLKKQDSYVSKIGKKRERGSMLDPADDEGAQGSTPEEIAAERAAEVARRRRTTLRLQAGKDPEGESTDEEAESRPPGRKRDPSLGGKKRTRRKIHRKHNTRYRGGVGEKRKPDDLDRDTKRQEVSFVPIDPVPQRVDFSEDVALRLQQDRSRLVPPPLVRPRAIRPLPTGLLDSISRMGMDEDSLSGASTFARK
jgi:hypothetical protein